MKQTTPTIQKTALIYCRVSSKKQRLEGGGLESQEQRCRAYAAQKGYAVDMMFPDDVSGGGDFMQRPVMRAMLAYIDAQPDKDFVVIFDDLKRFARQVEFHIKLRQEFVSRGVKIECLNFKIDDTPEGKFIETIIAAQGELEREQNRRQVVQKMKARVENGFWVFRAPVGYKYTASKGGGGKVLVRDEPLASTVQQALEGYANGLFVTQAEVQRFLEHDPHFPKDRPDGSLRPMTVNRLLKKVVYAGYVEAPKWDISVRKGQHDGLISYETYQRIQDNLDGRKRSAAARTDYNEDFPLRGFVNCASCGNAMTAAWSKGCRRHYAYYRCETRGCEAKSKSVPRARMEDALMEFMKSLQPTREYFELLMAMLRDAWEMRFARAMEERQKWQLELRAAEQKIESLLDRIVDAQSASAIKAYESRLAKLENQKLVLQEKATVKLPSKGQLETCIELSLKFLSSPCKIYEKGSYALKRSVLRLAFSAPVSYCRNEGYGTMEVSLPFKYLGALSGVKNDQFGKMVL